MKRAALVALLWLGGLAAPHDAQARDFFDPEQRTVRGTAYSLAPHTASFDASLFGIGAGDLIGRLGFKYGFGKGVQIETNLAHVGVGIINLDLKWNFLDHKRIGLSAGVGFLWGHGAWMWIFSGDEARAVAAVDVFVMPLELTASVIAAPWLQLDLIVRYTNSLLVGDFDSSSLLVDGEIGVRQFSLIPTVRLYLIDKLELYASAKLPAYTAIPGRGVVQTQLGDGVYAGARAAAYTTVSIKDMYWLSFGVRSALAKTSFIAFALNYGKVVETIYGQKIYPSLSVEHRF